MFSIRFIDKKNKITSQNPKHFQLLYLFDFIKDNYDYTTNLKRISMDDLKNLAQSNTLVNATIDNFVDKVGTFKQNNVQSLLFDDNI